MVHEFGNALAVEGETVVAAAHFYFDPADTRPIPDRTGIVYIFSEISGLLAWRQLYFGSTSDTGSFANEADFDNDGLRNLLEYGIGTVPNSPSAAGNPNVALALKNYSGVNYLSCVFTRDPSRDDVTLRVQAADSPIGPWTTLATSSTGGTPSGPGFISETDAPGGLNRVEVRDTVAIIESAPARRYLRLAAD